MLSSTGTAPLQPSLNNPRQISISGYSSIVYTVPAGRKFVGYIYGGGANSAYYLTPAGGSASVQYANATSATSISITPPQIVLVGGTVVTATSTQLVINGVESDL
jgi:hypothetical protein